MTASADTPEGGTVKLVTKPAVNIAMRTLPPAEADRVQTLFDALKDWPNDARVRKASKMLALEDGRHVYVLRTSGDATIFFERAGDTITVLDIASQETLAHFAGRG